jgi:hypothetical protein
MVGPNGRALGTRGLRMNAKLLAAVLGGMAFSTVTVARADEPKKEEKKKDDKKKDDKKK